MAGLLSTANAGSTQPVNHPIPIESKMDSKLKLEIALQVDSSITPNSISNGFGLGYSPITISNTEGNSNTLSYYIYMNKIKNGS